MHTQGGEEMGSQRQVFQLWVHYQVRSLSWVLNLDLSQGEHHLLKMWTPSLAELHIGSLFSVGQALSTDRTLPRNRNPFNWRSA